MRIFRKPTKGFNTIIYTYCCVNILVFSLAVNKLVVADDYMDALQDEASHLEYLDETRPGNTVSTQTKNISPDIQKAMTSINHFETYFRKKDSASAAIYFRLTTQERLRIYHRFKSTRNFDVARKMAIDLFNQK